MMDPRNDIPEIVREKFLTAHSVDELAPVTSGLSSALVFRCASARHGALCLRAWPPHGPTLERLKEIHQAISFACEQGVQVLPKYYLSTEGTAFLLSRGRFWELTQWMPGQANYLEQPSASKRTNAMQTLAWLHRLWSGRSVHRPSPAVRQRVELLVEAMQFAYGKALVSPAQQLGGQLARLAALTASALERHTEPILQQLLAIQDQPVETHFTLRDIWSDHVLFNGQEVTGIIDFGAARVDEPATDIARLLGSLEPDNVDGWQHGLEAYLQIRPGIERRRVVLLDHASCLLSALQWARWLAIENRQFTVPRPQLLDRWQGFLTRLDQFPWSTASSHHSRP